MALAVAAALAAGCGGSGSTPATSGQGAARSMQVLTTVQRGDLVQSVMGSVRLVVNKGKTTVVATVPKQSAASVAAGQTAAVVFFTPRTGAQGGQSGAPFPQGGQSGAPFPQGGQSGAPFPQGGQGGFGQGGFGGGFRGRGTPGTVSAVRLNADGSAAVTIAVKKLSATATAKLVGFATIQTQVLAANVIVIPTAAIKGSGSAATVQVLSAGKTSTRSVVVGKQAGAESEVVSGLSVGENIVWTRSFPRGGFFRGSGSPFPGQGQQGFGGGQSNGGQSGGGFQ
jgi:macrolide-specific efflux system membrane fusion protein